MAIPLTIHSADTSTASCYMAFHSQSWQWYCNPLKNTGKYLWINGWQLFQVQCQSSGDGLGWGYRLVGEHNPIKYVFWVLWFAGVKRMEIESKCTWNSPSLTTASGLFDTLQEEQPSDLWLDGVRLGAEAGLSAGRTVTWTQTDLHCKDEPLTLSQDRRHPPSQHSSCGWL
jgi:hypothetical protein